MQHNSVLAIGSAAMTKPDAPGLPNTTLPRWPTPLGRYWLIDGLHLGAGTRGPVVVG